MAVLVGQEGWRLDVAGLNPVGEQASLVCLVPQVLVEVSVCDLLKWLNVVDWNQMSVQIHKLDTDLFERSVAQ